MNFDSFSIDGYSQVSI